MQQDMGEVEVMGKNEASLNNGSENRIWGNIYIYGSKEEENSLKVIHGRDIGDARVQREHSRHKRKLKMKESDT